MLWRYGRFSNFQDGGRPSWICHTPVWTIHKVYFRGFCRCAKFGFNRCSGFDNMLSFNILSITLKNAYSRPFRGVFVVKLGKSETFGSFISKCERIR